MGSNEFNHWLEREDVQEKLSRASIVQASLLREAYEAGQIAGLKEAREIIETGSWWVRLWAWGKKVLTRWKAKRG